MKTNDLLQEMIDIALLHREVKNTTHLSKVALDANVIRLGCVCILKWLRVQSIALKIKPIKLRDTSEVDQSCALLVERSEDIRRVFRVNDGYLSFSDGVSIEEATKLMTIAKDKYKPPLLTKK